MNRIDATRPDSPRLAGPGPHAVGVRTECLTTASRSLTIEVWYPAAPGTLPGGTYATLLRDGVTPVTLHGLAARDAEAAPGRWPLVILSHGYPGNRFLMAHLGEALASRGYLVAAADHAGSTYDDQRPFGETLLNRPLDQRFLLAALAGHPLADPGKAAIIGYSMGGYGALVTAGAALDPSMAAHELAPPGGALAVHCAPAAPPATLRAVIAIGPWGNARGLWPEGAFGAIAVPVLVMAGSLDETSGYAAMRAIAEGARGALLTFQNAGHNAAAPIPAPAESHAVSPALGWAPFLHYADAVWDTVRLNALAQHFAAAFLDLHLKGDARAAPLLDPAIALFPEAGFAPGTGAGLRFEVFCGVRWG